MDIHAIWYLNGKLQPMQLVYVRAEDKICFGMIGTKRFCWSVSCRIKAHKLKFNKFLMRTKDGWFLAGKSNLAGQPNAFIRSFLDGSKVTEDTALTLKNFLQSGKQRRNGRSSSLRLKKNGSYCRLIHWRTSRRAGETTTRMTTTTGTYPCVRGTWFSQTPPKFLLGQMNLTPRLSL
jgi:hypothetical protein